MSDPGAVGRAKGFSVRIFIPSGSPDGLRTVEKSNWTGKGVVFPRALFAEARQRPELTQAGVYILWGPSESGQLPRVYVGEGDTVLARLEQHAREKDFWTHAAVFTSKDGNLNKAHVQYLEARLVELAAGAKRAELDNGNTPKLPSLSEADAADAEGFLSDLLLCLPIVGVDAFERPKTAGRRAAELLIKAKGIEARGRYQSEGLVVLAGSEAVVEEVPSLKEVHRELRRSLLESKVLEPAGNVYRFTQDYSFNAPSTAAAVVLGRPANGRKEWKDAHGRTLEEIQDEEARGSSKNTHLDPPGE